MNFGKNINNKLTVIVPSFNEEKYIEKCLESVLWADEILVVDSFSSDKTVEIAKKYTDRILQHEYINSAEQKNWTIPQAKYDWVLILDCDERVTTQLQNEIRELLKKGPVKDGYSIKRNNYLMGKNIKYSGWGRDYVVRLFRKDVGRYQKKRVHSEIYLENVGELRGCLDHYTVSSVNAWLSKINIYSSWKAEDKFEKGARLSPVVQLFLRPIYRFFKDFVLRLGILDGWRGFLIASMASFSEIVMIAKLIQLNIGNDTTLLPERTSTKNDING